MQAEHDRSFILLQADSAHSSKHELSTGYSDGVVRREDVYVSL